ncbi:hypothetical protein [Streptomyces sp. 8L]|uniref:hypothetical protein n=1 Tax=Streptomyces sp. 8L TaxID=2877242 RepID=UPI001CD2345B|nr:hypothetical protein [Streptomyces sp. 8L]MCA1219625.1 hypothetical protein [Streptomyces sp. 8L]
MPAGVFSWVRAAVASAVIPVSKESDERYEELSRKYTALLADSAEGEPPDDERRRPETR